MESLASSQNEPENIIGFLYKTGPCGNELDSIEINIKKNKPVCKYISGYIMKKNIRLSKKSWGNFVKEIVNINILKWEYYYDNPYIFDGRRWDISIYLLNGGKIKFCGRNAYPEEWDDFEKIVYRYFPIMKTGAKKIELIIYSFKKIFMHRRNN
jgi:hypothetical protein